MKILEDKFPNTYITHLSTGLWNLRIGDLDLGILQLLGCLEKLPQDLVVATNLLKAMQEIKYPGLFSGVKNYTSSFLVKSTLSQSIYSNLLGAKFQETSSI